jgi:hypothetical protein
MFERLSSIQNKFKKINVDKEDLIAIVLSIAPADYKKPVMTAEQRAKGNALTMDDLEEAMTQHYRTIMSGKEGGGKKSIAKSHETSFAIVCYKCRSKGRTYRTKLPGQEQRRGQLQEAR